MMEFVAKAKTFAIVGGILLLILSVGAFAFSRDGKATRGFLKPHLSLNSLDSPVYKVGDSKTFPVHDFSEDQWVNVEACCVKVGKYSYLFVQNNLGLPKGTLDAVGEAFDEEIYPGYSDVFSRRLSPGLNADYRVTILFLDKANAYPKNMKGKVVKGFYWRTNELSQIFYPKSAESKIIYIFSDPEMTDIEDLLGTVEHETKHLKNWAVFKNHVGMAFIGIFSLATLFTVYLTLSHLYFKFMEMKV